MAARSNQAWASSRLVERNPRLGYCARKGFNQRVGISVLRAIVGLIIACTATQAYAAETTTEKVGDVFGEILTDMSCAEMVMVYQQMQAIERGEAPNDMSARNLTIIQGMFLLTKGYAIGRGVGIGVATEQIADFCVENLGAMYIEAFE